MNQAMVCAKIGLDFSKLKKNTKKHTIFCSISTLFYIFQFQQNFSAKHCQIIIPNSFLLVLTPLSPLYLVKQWLKKNWGFSGSVTGSATCFRTLQFQSYKVILSLIKVNSSNISACNQHAYNVFGNKKLEISTLKVQDIYHKIYQKLQKVMCFRP